MHVFLFYFNIINNNNIILEDIEQNVDGNVTKNSTLKLANSSNDEKTLNSSSAVNTSNYLILYTYLIYHTYIILCILNVLTIIDFTIGIELFEKNLINPIKKQLSDINISKNEKGMVFI